MSKIEAENAAWEIRDIVDKCIECGMCKSLCPVFKIIREESISPRGKAKMLKKEIYDKIVYECSLCKACEVKCPANVKLCDAFRKARLVLVEHNKETKENKEMIKNIREYGNPFGKDAGKSKKLYCC
jgi:Fe-S oxidoreductase